MLACAADPEGDVAAGALWLAAEDCEQVDVGAMLARLDTLAAEVVDRLGGGGRPAPVDALRVLATTLHDRINLRGGPADDPRNHYLHMVIARGVGIPIACAAVWMGVGRRAGVEVAGIGLPGHFVVRIGGVLVDAHAGGEPIDERDALRLVGRALGVTPTTFAPTWLLPATPREMLARMSRNLRVCHALRERWGMALRAADRCVALLPDDPVERRERGMLRFRLGLVWPALRDLSSYLEAFPEADDRDAIEKVRLRAMGMLN